MNSLSFAVIPVLVGPLQVFLALLPILCYLFLIVGYGKRKDWIYFVICLAEVVVLVLAASGILGSGGH